MMPLFPCFTGNSISFAAILTDKNHDLGIVVEPRGSRTSLAQAHTDRQLRLHTRTCSECAFALPFACAYVSLLRAQPAF
jgi:hypothetical protein